MRNVSGERQRKDHGPVPASHKEKLRRPMENINDTSLKSSKSILQ